MTYIIAEVGNNHDGDPRKAMALVQAAIDCDVDAVKLQLFRAETLVSPDLPLMLHTEGTASSAFERMKSLELPWSVYEHASTLCHDNHTDFIVTPFDPDLLRKVMPLVDKIKIASGDLTYRALLIAAKESGKPVILSTGMANRDEIMSAKQLVSPWATLHCVSMYPTPADAVSLDRMRSIFSNAVFSLDGYSDHHPGPLACLAAVAAGALVIEKHFTLDRDTLTGDRSHSLMPDEMRQMVADIREIELMLPWNRGADFHMRKYLRRGKDGLRGSYRE